MEQINFMLIGSLPYEAALQGNLTLVDMFLITGCDCAFFVSGEGMLTTLLFLPVDSAQVGKRFTLFALDFKAFMANPYIKSVALISTVLHQRPLFPPDGDILSLIVLTILFLIKTICPDCPSRNNDVDVWIVFQWILPVAARMDGSNSAQAIAHKAMVNELVDNTD